MVSLAPAVAVELSAVGLEPNDEIVFHRPPWPLPVTLNLVRGEEVLAESVSRRGLDPHSLAEFLMEQSGLVLTLIQNHNYNQGDGECYAFVVE
jgi:hypothetical protein